MPNGRLIRTDRNRYDGSQPVVTALTGVELSTGLAPHGIINDRRANNRGIIGNDVSGFPTDGGMMFVPHRAIVRYPVGRASNRGLPTVDDTANIPAFAVGDPR
jgi:hypothetical protein